MKNSTYTYLVYLMKVGLQQLILIITLFNLVWAKESNGQGVKSVFDVKINLKVEEKEPGEVFQLIEQKTDYKFAFDKSLVANKPKISLSENTLGNVLTEVGRQAKLNFRQVDEIIAVSESKTNPKPVEVVLDGKKITGQVMDGSTNEPLIGVTVKVKGASIGTVTDVNGSFSFEAPEKYKILVFSYIGYVSQEVEIGSQSVFNISLEQDIEALEEVVVVGYGEQTKANLTGSVAKVEGKMINQRPITQGSQVLQGLTPGVFVNTNSGEPGNDDASVTIRGIGTFNDTEPLVLVDGIEAPLENINPHDIESVNILKDAASASIYGTRAANGVILITTKRGTQGKPVINYSTSYSHTSPTVLPNVVSDTRTYLETYVDAAEYSGRSHPFTPELIDELSAMESTNWIDDFIQTGSIADHNLSIAGGNEKVRYRFSNRYNDQQGYLKGDWYTKRYNARLNLDMNLSDKVTTGVSIAYTKTDNRQATKNDPNTTLIDGIDDTRYTAGKGNFLYTILLVSAPNASVYDEFGRYGGTGGESSRSQRDNPQALIDNQWIDDDANELLANTFIEYEPIKDLKFRYTTAINYQQQSFQETRLQYEQYDRFGNLTATRTPGSILKTREATTLNFTNWLQANYSIKVGDHKINLMAGVNQETSTDRRIATAESGFGSTSLVKVGNGTDISNIGNFNGDWALSSVFGRGNYSFRDTYLLEVNARRDGSSRFGSNSRYATFSGVSAGYVVSNENFWNLDFVSFLKLRGSLGRLGVQSGELYPFASEVTLGNDYNGNSGAALTKLGNPDLEWEETTTIDLGIDLELFDGMIYLEADYFKKESDGILTLLNNPLTSGINSEAFTINSANIVNEGWELILETRNSIGKLNITTNFNVTHIQNEVTRIDSSLGDEEDKLSIGTAGDRNVWLIRGEAINSIYGHEFGGVFQESDFNADGTLKSGVDYSWLGTPQPGDIKYTDQNGDMIIDETDRVVIGNRNPEWIYGANLNFEYEGFDLGLFFQGVGKVNSWVNRYTGNFGHSGLREFWTDGWTESNPSNSVPRVFVDREGYNGQSIEGKGGQAMNSFWVIDQSYLRLKNIMLGYTLPQNVIDKLPIQNLRIYISGQNLWTLTDLKDLDPERSQYSNHFGGTLPQAKSYTFGLSLTL